MTETKTDYDASAKTRYVRLAPTTLYLAPDCYAGKGKPDPLSDTCTRCCLRKHCQEKQEVIWK